MSDERTWYCFESKRGFVVSTSRAINGAGTFGVLVARGQTKREAVKRALLVAADHNIAARVVDATETDE